MRITTALFLGILFLGAVVLAPPRAAYAQETLTFRLQVRNLCETTFVINQLALYGGQSFRFSQVNYAVPPGESREIVLEGMPFRPERMTIVATKGASTYKAAISPIPYGRPVAPEEFGGCLELTATLGEALAQPPSPGPFPPSGKPLAAGMNLDQVISVLRVRGFQVREEGSRERPKLAGVDDPMLLRAIDGLSAHLIWVSAPGSLRSAIVWDDPAVDLDLLVFGLFPFGLCFQLTPPGVLAEACDRAPSGPVPGSVFAVLVINWSPQAQAYVLALSQ